MSTELNDFIVDNQDGLYDDSLHWAAWHGDVDKLRRLLVRGTDDIDSQLRPFHAAPLRLAAMNSHADCVALLLEHGASIDTVDRKAQTPLFCAVKSWDTDSCILLLQAGASPDGDGRNLSTPLHIACQDGYDVGVKLLLDFGAQIECAHRTPQWTHPLHLAATYQHLSCFILLLEAGADVTSAGHILHVVCTKNCDPLFVHLWVQFGGNLWGRNHKQQLAVDLPYNCHRDLLKELMENPLSLQSICRLKIRKLMGRRRLPLMYTLAVPQVLRNFLMYRDIPQVNQCITALNFDLRKYM